MSVRLLLFIWRALIGWFALGLGWVLSRQSDVNCAQDCVSERTASDGSPRHCERSESYVVLPQIAETKVRVPLD